MFFTIFFTVWTVLHVYVFWRISSVPFIASHVSGKMIFLIGVVLWTAFPLSHYITSRGFRTIGRYLEFLGDNWLGVLFLVFICLLAVDIVTGFGFFFPRVAPTIRGWALVAGLALSAFAFVQCLRPPVVDNFEVQMPGLPRELDGRTIVAIADLHLGPTVGNNWAEARVKQVNALNPDMILVLGDLVEGHDPVESMPGLAPILSRLSAPLGVWGVTGNHDRHAAPGRNLYDQSAIRLLHNEWFELAPGLVIAGIDDIGHFGVSPVVPSNIHKALEGRPSDAATVFLSHKPFYADTAASLGANLMLSGHTHGGQVWPFNYISARFNPLMSGRYDINGMTAIVCRGTGTWGPRMRLWLPNEILRITLRSAPSDRWKSRE